MKRSRAAIVIAVVTALIFCLNTAFVSAASLSQIRKDIKSKQTERAKIADNIEDYTKDMQDQQDDIDRLEASIAENEKEQKKKEQELKEAEEEAEEQSENLDARLRAMYKNGNIGFIDVLLESSSFSDFLTNLDLVEKVYTSDKDLLEDLQEKCDEIAALKAEIEERGEELQASKKLAEEEKAAIAEKRTAAQNQNSALSKDIRKLERAEAQKEAENARIEEMLQNQGSHSSNKGSGGGGGGGAVHPGGSLAFPLKGSYRFTSDFGYRIHPIFGYSRLHSGVDLAAPSGTHIYAAASGKVIQAWYAGGYGNQVLIDHGNGIATRYAHCSRLLVRTGQHVKRGQHIANVGSTGNSTGPHLHFEVRKNGRPVDPKPYINLHR